MSKKLKLLILSFAFAAMPVSAGADEPTLLEQAWLEQNDLCRGGPGDQRETWQACERRTFISQALLYGGDCPSIFSQSECADIRDTLGVSELICQADGFRDPECD